MKSDIRLWLLSWLAFTVVAVFCPLAPAATGPFPQSQEDLTRTVAPGRGVIFRAAKKNLHCVTYGAGYVWCGFSTSPSLLVKVDPDSMTGEPIRFREERGLHDLTFDGTNVWAAHSSGHLSLVDPDTNDIRTYRLKDRPFVYTSCFDGRDIWAGLYSEPGRLLRVDRQTGQSDEYIIHEAPRWSVRGIASDGKRLWASLYTVPAMVAIVDPRARTHKVLHLGRGDDLMLSTSIAFDGQFMWVGLDTMPATLVRIDVDTFRYRVYPLHTRSSCCRGLVFANGALWVGLYTEPAEILRLDRENERYEITTLPKEYFNTRDLACDGKNLWIGLQNIRYGPSALYRLPMKTPNAADGPETTFSVEPEGPFTPQPLRGQTGDIVITSQDWYRVRRGEDQIAWGQVQSFEELPNVILSRRAPQELAFLGAEERVAILDRLSRLSTQPGGPDSKPVRFGAGRRLSPVGNLRIVYRVSDRDRKVVISTIRKQIGVPFDPENMGPAPPLGDP